jgi:hypothetical protein
VRPQRTAHAAGTSTTSLSQSAYSVNEDAGHFPITIERTTDLSRPEVVHYGVTIEGGQAGRSFDRIANTRAVIAAGQRSLTFELTINDQGINGPTRYATAYIYGPSLGTLGDPSKARIALLQNDPLQSRDPQNPLDYELRTGLGPGSTRAGVHARVLELPLLDVEPAGRDAREERRAIPRGRRSA